MKRTLMSLVAIATLSSAAPMVANAQGQPGNYDRHDRQDSRQERHDDRRAGRWENLNQRQAQFQQRLDRALRDGRITRRQAATLRTEYRNIANLEQRYRRGGLNTRERAELDRRFDRLQASFRTSVQSSQYGYGYGEAPNLFDYLFGIR